MKSDLFFYDELAEFLVMAMSTIVWSCGVHFPRVFIAKVALGWSAGTWAFIFIVILMVLIYGLLASLTNQDVENPGYHTFNLSSPILLAENTNFYIKVSYSTPNYNWPIPMEVAITNYCSPTIETAKCWISSNNSTWTQIGINTTNLRDLCIRAFGENIVVPASPVLNSPK